jgi:hypothetical protein
MKSVSVNVSGPFCVHSQVFVSMQHGDMDMQLGWACSMDIDMLPGHGHAAWT